MPEGELMSTLTRRALGAVTALAVTALSGCALPDGVDGDLTGGWAPMADPEPMVPDAGVCHNNWYRPYAELGMLYLPVECTQQHKFETVHVDDLPEEAPAWSGSRENVLAEPSELHRECMTALTEERGGEVLIEELVPTDCEEPHQAQVAGVVRWEGTQYPAGERDRGRLHRDCRAQVAEYAGVPADGDLRFRTGTVVFPMDPVDWENGDRGLHCYLWLNGEDIVGALADVGPSGLPVR
jgi:hypothetical protein